ncbi:hypothetical protein KPL76_12785 [Subtercola sp. PAMC28395]|uniref:hypothetical protein n=1 Tax=Subtercola sp. PAMC28395 TaxID=2846775 RepID=UPI001C0DD165|nr:hypothetical protein [Subtercola sp. PAMC28395]QWT23568.1 hypothetical protein KPL76_12785 [Subtercola sp. PAMC28395]
MRIINSNRLVLTALLATSVGLGLTACSFSANPAVSSADFAKNVKTSLDKQSGLSTTVDCGSKDIDLTESAVVHCDVVGADSPDQHYDAAVTISGIKGGAYDIAVKVADQPKP